MVHPQSADREQLARSVAAERPRRLRLDYPSWIARIGTCAAHAAAIHFLPAGASGEVTRHFAIEPDGSFTIQTLSLVLKAA